jgi:hypothetical protein
MANEIYMRLINLSRRDEWLEYGMRALGRASGWQQAQPCGDAKNMCIDRESRMPTGEE